MLRFYSIHIAYADEAVLADVSFASEADEITCLVGPSGCGKTTLLRLAAGLLELQQGEIQIDGRKVANSSVHVPPEKRSVGLVFQEGALFPHLDVAGNIAFGLEGRRHDTRIDSLLEMTRLTELAQRMPYELSAGQRQRVALARALAPSPRVLLFDEPYANLDQDLRRRLRAETRKIVSEVGTVALFVTHDHDDVTALADRVVVLDDGRIVQSGSPRELFDHPQHGSVARLFGETQQIAASKSGDILETPFGRWPANCLAIPIDDCDRLELLVRPDGLRLEAASEGLPVTELRMDGPDDLVGVMAGDGSVVFVRSARPHAIEPGVRVTLAPVPGRIFPELVANGSYSQ